MSEGPSQVTVPRVVDLPCDQAQQVLKQAGLNPRLGLIPTGIVRQQNPQENTPVPPGSEVQIQCF